MYYLPILRSADPLTLCDAVTADKIQIRVSTPTRIDLAGGTLDLYPIYLFEDGGLTVNCAIDQYCRVLLQPRNDERVVIRSMDLEAEEEYDNCRCISTNGQLSIVSRAVQFFHPAGGLSVTTENCVRKGSGLGASSSLLIGVLGALNAFTNSEYSPEQLIDIAANLEAQCIRVPTGKQDYCAAFFGGISGLWFDLRGIRREPLASAEDYRELEDRLILSFTGIPRFSGAPNWNMMKNYIDENHTTRRGMKEIKQIALEMRSCILKRDWDEFALLVSREWNKRRELAEGVSTDSVERIMQAAVSAGALANKLCGAGGGGCMITCIRPEDRRNVEAALSSSGAEVLPFRLVPEGMKIEYQQMENE